VSCTVVVPTEADMGPKLDPPLAVPIPPPIMQEVSSHAPSSSGAEQVRSGPAPASRSGPSVATSPEGPPQACRTRVPASPAATPPESPDAPVRCCEACPPQPATKRGSSTLNLQIQSFRPAISPSLTQSSYRHVPPEGTSDFPHHAALRFRSWHKLAATNCEAARRAQSGTRSPAKVR